MIGKTIAHYKVLDKIGEGGMGVVYKAEDTKLKRTVALKFLPPEMTRDPQAKARFTQEAQAAAALDHPNICAVHEIGEAEGATYIAMPYIKGQSLKEKIAAGPLLLEEALDIAGQVAEGLKEAHEKGIIHRDIKPANIILTEKGQAKIMDFGLAKLTAVADITKTMTVMGTVAYMSPEQARGEAVDHRTDIWSFGATLYEMLTGQMPFGRKHDQALIYSILNDIPEPLSRLRKDIPRPVEQLVLKTLQRDKLHRYQNMAELLKDLKAAQVYGFSMPKVDKSIIVLPFENISPDPEQEYFCDGMTEEIITDLSHVRDLLVISRSSAMTFKGTKKTIPEIAGVVNVRYVLEGSVRKAGSNLRITAQLIDSATDAHLWAEKYSGTLDDVFDIQEKVSRSIVDALKLKLTPEEKKKMTGRPIDNVAAYECFLKANAEILRFTEDALNRALLSLQSALDMIGDNALLFSAMAYVHWQYVNIGVRHEESIEKSEEYAKKALSLDPDISKAHVVNGLINLAFRGNQRKAVEHFKRALALSPDEPLSLEWLACCYIQYIGKIYAAIPLLERIIQIDPLNVFNFWFRGLTHLYDGQYGLALVPFCKLLQTDPENPVGHLYYAWALACNGEIEEAICVIDKSGGAFPDNKFSKAGLLLKYVLLKDKENALREMTGDFQKTCRRDAANAHFIGVMLALLDEKNLALDWLENAVNRGFINYPLLAEKDPFLQNIRGEERFQKLMERVKYEWEHFEV